MQEDEFKLKATILSGERIETETCCQAEAVYIIYILPGRVLRRVNANMEAQNRHFFNINFFSKYQYIKQKRI
jgi:hypothetical protein